MASMSDTNRFRSRAAASQTTGSGGGSVDETQRRLGVIEATLAEIKATLPFLATKEELKELRGHVQAIEVYLPHFATKVDIANVKADIANVKTDIANLHTAMIKWVVGTMIGCAAASYSVARLFG